LSKQIGRFELANGSTLFLDEIGDLPSDVQVKLLRVLQEKQIEALGGPRIIPVDVRIIAASNHDLEKAVREWRFAGSLLPAERFHHGAAAPSAGGFPRCQRPRGRVRDGV
jgi:transcriptional regulator with GAF, ATPase, and Fis domain